MASLLVIRKALRDQLAANVDIKAMFGKAVLEDTHPTPSDTDCIVVRKNRVREFREEFGGAAPKTVVFEVVIDAVIISSNEEDADEKQIKADQYIREAIETDITLGCLVSWCNPTYTQWGSESSQHERYHTMVNLEINTSVSPTDRD